MVKNPPANAGDIDSIPGSGKSSGGGNGSPLRYLLLPGEPHGQRGAWRAAVHGVIKSHTRLEQLSTHTGLLPS